MSWGFSIFDNLHPASPKSIQQKLLANFHLTVGNGRCSWVTQGWKNQSGNTSRSVSARSGPARAS